MRRAHWIVLGLSAGLFAQAMPAAAQLYQWREANGRVVFSDTPPPPNIPPGNIIKAPKGRSASPAAAPAAAPPADGAVPEKGSFPGISGTPGGAPKPATGQKSVADREAEFKKRQAEAAEKSKKDEEVAAETQRREANCRGLRQNLAALEGGQRIRRLNDKGEPYFVDDAERAKDIERMRREMAAAKCS